jgi:glutaminase
MNTQRDFDEGTQASHVSTGRLPPAEFVRTLVAEAHGRYKFTAEGTNSQAYPALAEVASDSFGVCVVRLHRGRGLCALYASEKARKSR